MRRIIIHGGIIIAAFFIFCSKSNAQVIELACPLGTTSVQALQTTNTTNGKIRQNYCVDLLGNVFENTTGTTAISTINAFTQPGAHACAKITAAEALLPASGGIVDARGFQGFQDCTVTPSASFNVGSTSQVVKLLLGNNVKINVPSTVTIFSGSTIEGSGPDTTSGTFLTDIQATGGFPSNTPLVQFQSSGGVTANLGPSLRYLKLDCNSQTGCTGVDFGDTQDFTYFQNVSIGNYLTKCINTTTVGSLSELALLVNVECAASSLASGTTAVTLNSSDHWTFINFASAITAGGSVQANSIQCNSCNLYLQGAHFENHTDAILLTGSSGGSVFVGGVEALGNVTNMVHIASTWTGAASLHGIHFFSGAGTQAVKNDIAAFNNSCPDKDLPIYELTSTSSSPQQVTTTCSTLNSNFNKLVITGNGLAPVTPLSPLHIRGTSATQDLLTLEDPAVRNITISPSGCSGGGLRIFDVTGAKLLSCLTVTTPPTLIIGTSTATVTIANGTATMTTAAIAAGACGTTVTVASANVLATDIIIVSFNAAPAGTNAGLTQWPTAGNVNFAYCPGVAETPAAATINWKVVR